MNRILKSFTAAALCFSLILCIAAGNGRRYGDVNGDGRITTADALSALKIAVSKVEPDEAERMAADVNADGKVTAIDALWILQYSVRLIDDFPAETTTPEEDPPLVSSDASAPEETNSWSVAAASGYYCYSQLDSVQRQVYNFMKTAAENYTEGEIDLPPGVSDRDLNMAFVALKNDCPQLYQIPYGYRYSSIGGRISAVEFLGNDDSEYVFSAAQYRQMNIELETKIQEIFSAIITDDMDEAAKAEALHDYIVQHAEYDYAAAEDNSRYPKAYTAYGILVEGRGVCEGFTRAYQILLYRAGILSTPVSGKGVDSEENHMWSAVRIHGDWYLTDVTWDNSAKMAGDKVFYNQTAAIFASSHIPSPSISEITGSLDGYNFDLPTFTATRENYFIKHGLYFADKADFDANFPARLAQAVEKGDREIQVMLADRAFREADDVTGLLTADIITAADRLAGNEGKHIESYTYGFVSGGHSFAISW